MNIQIKDRLYDEFLKEPTKDNFCEFVKNNCGEFNEVDYKKTWPDKGKLAKIILAMANSHGGIIIIGVEEQSDGKIIPLGLENFRDKADVNNDISKYILPGLDYEIYDFSYDGAEYSLMENRKFQMVVIHDTPERLPFISLAETTNLVLDDPISSFDTNKKYAIIHRMFSKQSGILPRSFYKKTVLMLTHDFEPIIDFGVVGKLPEDALNSKFIKNNQGILTEKAIDYKQDIKPVVQALAAYIKDDTLGIVHRIAFLRKYYEHNGIENYKEAYDVLSSLIHGRDKCKYVNNSEMPQAEIQKGCTEIKKWIQNFDYDELYRDVYNEEKLAELYFAETNDYLKIQLFRALFEVNPSREIKEEDVLVKFINESYHIENDYAYYLDMVKFETVPEYIVKAIDDYMERTYSKA